MSKSVRIATGVRKLNGHYRVKRGNKERSYRTVQEAIVGRCVDLAMSNVLKGIRKAVPQAERRITNLETHGNCLEREREVSLSIVDAYKLRFPDRRVFVCNDSTRADFAVEVTPDSGLYLGVQLKTSNECSTRKNKWSFNCVRGYKNMPVIGWRIDKSDGWVWDGSFLDSYGGDTLAIYSLNSEITRKSVHKGLIDMTSLVEFLGDVTKHVPQWDLHTSEYLSWEFKQGNRSTFLERVTLQQCKSSHLNASFPQAQAESYDLDNDGERLQLKHACCKDGRSGFTVTMCKMAGTVNGKHSAKPYAKGDFDTLIVMHVLWHMHKVLVWRFPSEALGHYLSDESDNGITVMRVHPTEEMRMQYGLGATPSEKRPHGGGAKSQSLWTREYCVVEDLVEFPVDAEGAAAGHFAHFRAGGTGKNGD